MKKYVLTGYLLFLLGFAAAAPLQAASVSECILQSENGLSCLGEVTRSCLATEKNPVDDIVHECYQSEYVQWNQIVTKAARSLKNRLKGDALGTFKAAQKAWELYRTKSCRLPYQVMQGRAALLTGLSCNRDVTARRALDLLQFQRALK